MKIHVLSMLAKGVETINKQTQQTSSQIAYCNEYKYLGIWFNEHLDTNQTIEHIGRSARKALAEMCARYRQFGGFHYKLFTLLYNSLVVPILDYIWCMFIGTSAVLVINFDMPWISSWGVACKTMPSVALTSEMG